MESDLTGGDGSVVLATVDRTQVRRALNSLRLAKHCLAAGGVLLLPALSCSLTTSLDGLAGGEPQADAATGAEADVSVTSDQYSENQEAAADLSQGQEDAVVEATKDSPVAESVAPDQQAQEAEASIEAEAGNPIEPDQACEDRAAALCDKVKSCVGDFAMDMLYNGEANCKKHYWDVCLAELQALGSGATPQQEEQCAVGFTAMSCEDLVSSQWPKACAPTQGTLSDGKGCWNSSQCTSSHCNVEPGHLCGFCAQPLLEGQTCQHDGQCRWPYQCYKGTCRGFASEGEPCSARPCKVGFYCEVTCKPVKALDATCSGGVEQCDTMLGQFCSADNVCAQGGTAQQGGLCGPVNGSWVWCAGGGSCIYSAGERRCMTVALNGSCAVDGGTPLTCASPAACFEGKCAVPNAVSCP